MNETKQKFCIDCKHHSNIASISTCLSPRNYRDLVTGRLIMPFCSDSRYHEDGPCKEEGLLFESKEICSYD